MEMIKRSVAAWIEGKDEKAEHRGIQGSVNVLQDILNTDMYHYTFVQTLGMYNPKSEL